MSGKKEIRKKSLRLDIVQTQANPIIKLLRENDIIAMLLDGRSDKEIKPYIMNKYRIQTRAAATNCITSAKELIKKRKNYEVNTLISIHIKRYEYIYTVLNDMGAWSLAMGAMKAKERLLGFHKQGFHMKVTQGEIHQIQQVNVMDEYNFDKLNKERKEKLISYLDRVQIIK